MYHYSGNGYDISPQLLVQVGHIIHPRKDYTIQQHGLSSVGPENIKTNRQTSCDVFVHILTAPSIIILETGMCARENSVQIDGPLAIFLNAFLILHALLMVLSQIEREHSALPMVQKSVPDRNHTR
jgi:hypothetical protein